MATNFPGSLDSFTNPSSSSTLDSPSHAAQHANINDAMEAVQTKLGTGAGTIGEWTGYTPTITNFTVASGPTAEYATLNDLVFFRFQTTYISSVSARMEISLPVAGDTSGDRGFRAFGTVNAYDSSLGDTYVGIPVIRTSTTLAIWYIGNTPNYWGDGGTVPFTWGAGDDFGFSIVYTRA